MPDIITTIGAALGFNLLQLGIGCVLAFFSYHFISARIGKLKANFCTDCIFIVAASILGILLPLGVYGVIPVIAALLAIGFQPFVSLPLLFSNSVFNMLVSWTDPSFTWKTGFLRVAFAMGCGIILGLFLKVCNFKTNKLIHNGSLPVFHGKPPQLSGLWSVFREAIMKMAILLVCGVVIDNLFHKYLFWNMLNQVYTNPSTSFIPRIFSGLDVVNPFFLITLSIFGVLLDLTRLSGLLVLFKKKGIILYFSYFFFLVIITGISAFF